MVRRQNKSHKNKIAEDESPPRENQPEVPEELQKALDALGPGYEGAGGSNDPNDMTWIGGRDAEDFDPEEHLETYLDDEIGELRPLELILLAVIRAHPNEQQTKKKTPKTLSDEEARLRNAMRYLTGPAVTRGRLPKKVDWPVLRRVAWQYYVASLGLPENEFNSLRQILIGELYPNAEPLEVAANKSRIDEYSKEFARHRHKLLVEVAYANDPDVAFARRSPILRMINDMRRLGIPVGDPFKKTE